MIIESISPTDANLQLDVRASCASSAAVKTLRVVCSRDGWVRVSLVADIEQDGKVLKEHLKVDLGQCTISSHLLSKDVDQPRNQTYVNSI